MTWVVESTIENPFGICFNEDTGYDLVDYRPYARINLHGSSFNGIWVEVFAGTHAVTQERVTHSFRYNYQSAAAEYIRRVYDLPDDTSVNVG